MSKIQIKAEVDIKSLIKELNTLELESFVREITSVLDRRKTKNKKIKEVRLLEQLNLECVLFEEDLNRFVFLKNKRQKTELPEHELNELFDLISKEEKLRLKRINVLGELALLKGISLQELITQLEINSPQIV